MKLIDEINEIRSRAGLLELELPELKVGDEMMVGKFKNRKATITGFTTDKHGQPIAKTDKGDQQIFKGRIKKLMDEPGTTDDETVKENTSALVNTQIQHRSNRQMKQLNEINDIRMRAGLPIMEDTEDMDEMLRVLRALKGAYMALSQIKTDLEDDHLVSRMGMNNGEYLNSTVGDQLAEISEVLSRYSSYVKDESTKEEEAPDTQEADDEVYAAPEYEEASQDSGEQADDNAEQDNTPDQYEASDDSGEPETPEYEKIGENTSAGGMGAGAIGSSVTGNKKGTSSFHELVRKNEKEAKCKGKEPKQVETIFAISQE